MPPSELSFNDIPLAPTALLPKSPAFAIKPIKMEIKRRSLIDIEEAKINQLSSDEQEEEEEVSPVRNS